MSVAHSFLVALPFVKFPAQSINGYRDAHPAKKWTQGGQGKSFFDVARLDDIFDFASRFILPAVQVIVKKRR
jgi:hypothetical protein